MDDTVRNLAPAFFVWSYKLATLAVGYLFARLGYTLFLKGVSGEFKFHVEAKGAKADLISASPGLFLILMGAVIISAGLYKGLTIDSTTVAVPPVREISPPPPPLRPDKPQLPKIPAPVERAQ